MSRESYRREFDAASELLKKRQCIVHINTHRVTERLCCDGLCFQRNPSQGGSCPLDEPKEPPVSNYRTHSSAWTGRTPRTTEERWPSAPVAHSRGWFARFVLFITGH